MLHQIRIFSILACTLALLSACGSSARKADQTAINKLEALLERKKSQEMKRDLSGILSHASTKDNSQISSEEQFQEAVSLTIHAVKQNFKNNITDKGSLKPFSTEQCQQLIAKCAKEFDLTQDESQEIVELIKEWHDFLKKKMK